MEFTPSFYLPQMGQCPCLGKRFVQCKMELPLTEDALGMGTGAPAHKD